MGLIKSTYSEEIENQVAWNAFMGGGGANVIILMAIWIKIKEFTKLFRRINEQR